MRAFGMRLRRLRTDQGLSQEDLADRAGISANQVSRIENGQINMTISTLFALAQALETDPGALLAI